MVNYLDVLDFDFSNATTQQSAWVHQALAELNITVEGNALLQKVKDDGHALGVKIVANTNGEIGYNRITGNIDIDFDTLVEHGTFYLEDGALAPRYLQRTLIHELFHSIDDIVGSSGTEGLRESRAIHFSNEFMSKYYAEDLRIIHGGRVLSDYSVSPSTPLNPNFNSNGYSGYAYQGSVGSSMLELLNINSSQYLNNENNYFYNIIANTFGLEAGTDVNIETTNTVLASGRSGDDNLNMDNVNVIYSFVGNDTISINDNGNYVFSGENDDVINSNGLGNKINGGSGEDTVDYSSAAQGVNVNFAISNNDTVEGVEYFIGSNYGDAIVAETLNSTIDGAGGDDILIGSSGADVFRFDRADGDDTIEGQNSSSADRIEIYYNNNSVSQNLASGVAPSVLAGEAKISDHPSWGYEMSYGGHQAYFNWGGDPTVAGSRGTLVIDFDPNTFNLKDLTVKDFASGHFGIRIEGAEEEEDEDDGEGVNPFTTPPGNGGGGHVWGPGLISGPGWPIYTWELIEDEDIIFDGGVIVVGNEVGIAGFGDDANLDPSESYTIVALRGTDDGGSEFPEPTGGSGVIGDPHVVSFDGLFYDFQDTGEFTLARNTDGNSFNVQARMREWDLGDAVGEKFSVNTAIATELNGVKVGFYIKGSLPYDLVAAAADTDTLNDEQPVLYIGENGYFLPDQGIILVEDGYVYRNGDTYTVLNGTGDIIQVTVHEEYIDLRTSAPSSRQGNVEGLLGNYDGDTTNDFTLDNGTNLGSSISTNTLYDVFGEDWRITQGESLFLYGEGENTSSFNNPDFDNLQRTVADFDPALVSAAQAAALAEGFDPTSIVFDAVVLDFLVMGYVEYDEDWEALEQQALVQANISNPSDIIMGTLANDSMIGTVGQDYMMGLDGNDTIYGRADDDTIVGGAGDDIIYGEAGIDTYIHNVGDGNDHIFSGEYLSLDKVIMNGVANEDLFIRPDSGNLYNLLVTDKNTGETVTIVDQYRSTGKTMASVNGIDVRAGLEITATDASEVIHGTGYADTIEGGLGDDTIYGRTGVDVYIHNEGDGNDIITSGEANSSDSIIMKDASGNLLAQEDLQFLKTAWNSPNLVVVNRVSGETITITNQFAYSGKTMASVNGIDITGGLNFSGTDAADIIYATNYADTIEGGLGDDVLNGYAGIDTYIHNAGDGNDTIVSGEPNSSDTIIMKDGSGNLLGQEDLQFVKSYSDLVVINRSTGESLTIKSQFAYSGKTIASINGIDITEGLNFIGTDASEAIYATNYSDTIEGGLGDDAIYGYAGIDTYIHNEGDGNDTIVSGEANSSDTIIMKDASGNLLGQEDLQFVKSSWNLLVINKTNGEFLTIHNQFYTSGKTIASINGIDITDGLNFEGTDAAENIYGTNYADTLEGGLGNDTLNGSYGADLYIHNEGDGNDTLISGEYNSSDVISMRDSNGIEIDAVDLTFSQSVWNLVVTDTNSNETLVLQDMYRSTGHPFDYLNGIDLDTVM